MLFSPVQHAITLLKLGKLVAIPTETVYGLAADANNISAIHNIFRIKNRPLHTPLTLHIHPEIPLTQFAIEIPKIAYPLIQAFWPGPLTLILRKKPNIPDIITANSDNIGLRAPNHPLTLEILTAFENGLVAPSANIHNAISPTTAAEVNAELGNHIDFILDGGECNIGMESTLLDLTRSIPTILRLGAISQAAIEKIIKQSIEIKLTKKNYQTNTPIKILSIEKLMQQIKLIKSPIGVISRQIQTQIQHDPNVYWIQLENHPNGYAQKFYTALKQLDALKLSCIFIETLPNAPAWHTISSRIQQLTC